MQVLRVFLALVAVVSMPFAALAQTVDEVFEGLIETENAGYEAVENYLLKTESMGMTTFEYYEKTSSLTLDNGQTVYIMRNVPPDEIQERQSGPNAMSNATPGELRNAALQIEDAGRQMEAGMLNEMQGAGLPGGMGSMLMNPPPDQPWLSANPRDMTSMYAMMLRGAADAKEERANEDPVGDAEKQAADMAAIKSQTRITRRFEFRGIDAIELMANDLNRTEVSDGQEFTLNSMKMVVDAANYVPLLLTMDGVVSDGNERRPMTIEREDMDYRKIPGCGEMYRPFRSVMRLGGLMTPEQQAEMAEASAQLEEFEAQMASMPESQRQMMESMMGPRLDMIRNMASSGGMELETKITELRCNTGLPDPMEIVQTTFGGAVPGANAGMVAVPERKSAAPADDPELISTIQESLIQLGYNPGGITGSMNKATVVAITKFEVRRGLTVTGQPSWELAGLLGRAIEDGAFRADE